MEITEDIPERSFNKSAADLSSDNQNIWKKVTATVEIQSENSISLTLSQQWEVFMHALRVWVFWTVRVNFIVYRENRLLYISHQPFNHYISKR